MPKSAHSSSYRVFLERLREARLSRDLTQEDVAERLGWAQSLVSKCERGVRRLDVVELRDWCHAIGVPFQRFAADLDKALPVAKSRRK